MTAAAEDLLLLHLAAGRSVGVAAELAGMSRQTAHRRMRGPDFAAKLDAARKEFHERVAGRLADQLAGVA
jgi:hypothetical protein